MIKVVDLKAGDLHKNRFVLHAYVQVDSMKSG